MSHGENSSQFLYQIMYKHQTRYIKISDEGICFISTHGFEHLISDGELPFNITLFIIG